MPLLNDVQESIISELKGYAALTTALGGSTEIREDDWPSSDWNYPCVRVALNSPTPLTTGKCHLTAWTVTFSVFVFTQPALSSGIYDSSSKECGEIMDHVVAALFGERITSPGNFYPETAVNITGQNAPVPELPPGGWRGEVLCQMTILEL